MNERVRTGIHVVRTVASIFPYLNLERKSEADQSLDVVWTDASWNRSISMQMSVRTKIHVVRTVWHVTRRMKLWTDERPDGMARRSDGWQGTEISDLYNSAESS
jgi:hypothetical protein